MNTEITKSLINGAQDGQNTLPNYFSTFDREVDGETETGVSVKLSGKTGAMTNGESFVARIAVDPNEWQEFEGQYDQPSRLAIFAAVDSEVENDDEGGDAWFQDTFTGFVRVGSSPLKSKGRGKSLYQRFCEFGVGELVSVKLVEKKARNGRSWKMFVVTAVDDTSAAKYTQPTPATTIQAPASTTVDVVTPTVDVETFMPKVRLTSEQEAILNYLNDTQPDAKTVKEVLSKPNKVNGEEVTFSDAQVQAILQKPEDYGLVILA